MKQSQKQGEKNQVGAYGESITAKYLERKGFTIIDTNYLEKWGEIDVIAKKTARIHFVEVKTVSYETIKELKEAVSRGTWRPEENVHEQKIKKLARAIETWMLKNSYEGEWQIDVAAVRVVPRETYATIKYIENIVIS